VKQLCETGAQLFLADNFDDLPFRLICRELGSAMSYTQDVPQLHPVYCLLSQFAT
jgi:hypothetical protein